MRESVNVLLKCAEHFVIAALDGIAHGKGINAILNEIMDYLLECSFHKNVLLSCDGRIIVRNLKKTMCKMHKKYIYYLYNISNAISGRYDFRKELPRRSKLRHSLKAVIIPAPVWAVRT